MIKRRTAPQLRRHAAMNGTVAPLARGRFTLGSTVLGYEVVDHDGTPVSESYVDPMIAGQVRDELNMALSLGNPSMWLALEELA